RDSVARNEALGLVRPGVDLHDPGVVAARDPYRAEADGDVVAVGADVDSLDHLPRTRVDPCDRTAVAANPDTARARCDRHRPTPDADVRGEPVRARIDDCDRVRQDVDMLLAAARQRDREARDGSGEDAGPGDDGDAPPAPTGPRSRAPSGWRFGARRP